MKKVILVIFSCFLLSCGGIKQDIPLRAHVSAPDAWRSGNFNGANISAEWWSSFGDDGLSNIVETALKNNIDIELAVSRVEEARAQYQSIKGQTYPSLALELAGDRDRSVDPFLMPIIQNQGQALMSVSYDVDFFGKLSSSSAAAKATILSTESAQQNIRLSVAASAATGYVNLLALDAKLAVLRDTLNIRAETLKIAKHRANIGYTSQLDLQQAEAEYHSTKQQIPAMELAIVKQEDALSLLLGENPRTIKRTDSLKKINLPIINSGLPSSLLRRRPDIMQAEQQIVVADKSLDAARAEFMPSFELTASAGYFTSSLLHNPMGVFSLGGNLLTPIFEGGRLDAKADVMTARRNQAAFIYRKVVINAFKEVEDAIQSVQSSSMQESALLNQKEALLKTLIQAKSRYKNGYTSYLDELDAQRGLLSNELALIQSRSDEINASIYLFQALGGGWDSLDVK